MRQAVGKAVGDEQVTDRLSMAPLFGSRPEWGHGLHNSLAGGRSQAEARGFPAAYNHLDFSVCSAAFLQCVCGGGTVVVQEEEEQDSDTQQSSVSFCRTNNPKQMLVARKLATRHTGPLRGRGCPGGPGPGLRKPETDSSQALSRCT